MDVTVGKLGYSTLAEAHSVATPYMYIPRDGFRETEPLAAFARARMVSEEISLDEYRDGSWVAKLTALQARPRATLPTSNGADQVAEFILDRLP